MQNRQPKTTDEVVVVNNNNPKRVVNLLPDRCLENLIIDWANVVYAITWLLIIVNQKSPKYDDRVSNVVNFISSSIFVLTALINLPLSLYGWRQSKRDINYKSASVAIELKKTQGLISGTQHQRTRQWTLGRTTYDDAKPFHVTVSRFEHQLSWEIGAGTVLKQAEEVYKIIQRLDNVFNPKPGGSRVLTQFIGNILRGENINLVNGGAQQRCFTYIGDGINALIKIIENKDNCAHNRIFNIGNPQATTTVLGLAQTIIRLIGSKSEIVFKPHPGAEVEMRVPDITKARTLLDHKPSVGLDEGLTRSIKWYSENAT